MTRVTEQEDSTIGNSVPGLAEIPTKNDAEGKGQPPRAL